jgi:microcystin-dependent protein
MSLHRTIAATLLVVALIGLPAPAAIPPKLTEQGRLFNADGSPVNGAVTLTFAVYDAGVGGSALWTETQSITLADGYFAVQLGALTPLPGDLWGRGARFIGLTVNGDPEMVPREEITSTAYALVANDAVGDIHPTTISVNGQTIVDSSGRWIGPGSAPAPSGGGSGSVPTGTIAAFGGAVPPDGWLICDGSSINRADQPALYKVIGTSWGDGKAPGTTFAVPDLRGRFLRGVDKGAGRDKDATSRTACQDGGNSGDNIGSIEGESFAAHSHGANDSGHSHGLQPGRVLTSDIGNVTGWAAGGMYGNIGPLAATASSKANITVDSAGGSETRPVNAAVYYIIKL